VVLTRPGTSFFIGIDHHAEADRAAFDARRTGLDHVALAVAGPDEVRAWVDHLDRLGVEHDPLREGDQPMPFAVVQLRDPDGVPIELMWTGS
jgi:glyoxylase I family protein